MTYTMEDFKSDIQRAKSELNSIGVYDIDENINLVFNERHTSYYGRCSYNYMPHSTTIELMTTPISFMTREQIYMVVLHECVHAVHRCWGHHHKGNWKLIVDTLNNKYGYNMQRCSHTEGLQQYRLNQSKYIVKCESCGAEFPRQKKSRIITHTKDYRCNCGGKLKRIK